MCINRKNEHIIKCHSFSNEIKIFKQKLIKTKKVVKSRKKSNNFHKKG